METKKCSCCHQVLSVSSFYRNKDTVKTKSKRGKLFERCIECNKLRGKTFYNLHKDELVIKRKEYRERKYKEDPGIYRGYSLKYKYGITNAEYLSICEKQNNKCAICNKDDKLFVDHNHETDKVRDLICSSCNKALGHARENIDVLESMILYIKKHQLS